jgi:hypothetical protein
MGSGGDLCGKEKGPMIAIFLVFMCVTALMGLVVYRQALTSPIVPPVTYRATQISPAATERTGTVPEFVPGHGLILKTESAEPLHYKFDKTVTYVTPDGEAIEVSKIRKDATVRVHYRKDGDDMIVDKVIVKRDRDETVQFFWLILEPS